MMTTYLIKKNMRSQHEPQVFSAVIKDAGIERNFLDARSSSLITSTSLTPVLSWENLRLPERLIHGMKIIGFSNLQKETYEDWLSINNQPSCLTPLITNPHVTLISERQSEQIINNHDYRWSIIYTLTRPGFSIDFSQALIQITAHCPAGPPQYGSLLYLERTSEQWQVQSSYGLYNQ
ncbi:hypothetical protein [Halotia branconii]|uniref:Uncharacterized protein n=1 Tax=Halotia branconii CENA392 TaxID=1539056 RepID=A0AAJ6NSX2_9CYAN|nr:hypothetical protein [Halotia branconii]WGV25884.1 hypothetical protein QI031_29945 [Halotia branconii CENA392]